MHIELVIAKLVTMGLGFLIAYQAYRGYSVHGSEPMLYVAIGFVFISFGAVIEGILFDVAGMEIFPAAAIQTTIVAVGMVFILYSLYGMQTTARGDQEASPDASNVEGGVTVEGSDGDDE